jgi:hypothetical protein
LNALLMGLTLLLTVVVALAMGIYLGYGLINGILHLMGNHHDPLPPAPILATSQAQGGD